MAETLPAPRHGILGAWDRLVGPGMTTGETAIVLAACILGAIVGASSFAAVELSPIRLALVAVIGFDVFGGAVCNATETTKSWYHRPGQTWRAHITFVLPHILYVVLVAGLLRGHAFDWHYAALVSCLLLVSTAVVLLVSARLQRPVAFALYLLDVGAISISVGLTHGLEWFVPALFLKLLIGHLVPEQPSQRRCRA